MASSYRKRPVRPGRDLLVRQPSVSQVLVMLVGEFNGWDTAKNQLTRRKNGNFSATISLKPGNSYRFRYWFDGERWDNDWNADQYVPNSFGTEDSVVTI